MSANKHIHGIIISIRLFIYLLALPSNSSLAAYCHLSLHQSTFTPSLFFVLSSIPHVPFTHFIPSFSLPLFVNVILFYFLFTFSFFLSFFLSFSLSFFLSSFPPSFPPSPLRSFSYRNHNNSISREFFYVVSCIPRSSQRLIFSLLPVLPVQLTITTST